MSSRPVDSACDSLDRDLRIGDGQRLRIRLRGREAYEQSRGLHASFSLSLSADGGPNKVDYLIWVRNRERPAHVVPRMAIVRTEELADDMDFVLLTGQNRGIAVWDFTDEDEARSWLVQS